MTDAGEPSTSLPAGTSLPPRVAITELPFRDQRERFADRWRGIFLGPVHGRRRLAAEQMEALMVRDLGNGFVLRRAVMSDQQALKTICLKTGDSGADATGKEDDPDLVGLIYAVPYQIFAHEHAFVIDGPLGVCGYVLGAVDSTDFYARLNAEWFPRLAEKLPDPGPDQTRWRGSDWARRFIHHPSFALYEPLRPWPAHGHIDLLPEVQGRGFGRAALTELMMSLKAAGAPGLHLGVSPRNTKALGFYERLGFARIEDARLPDGVVFMVRGL